MAPSHLANDLMLTNVKAQLLPSRETSMVQPMDADVIAAFKRRYRRFHLQNAIDCDERRETFYTYQID